MSDKFTESLYTFVEPAILAFPVLVTPEIYNPQKLPNPSGVPGYSADFILNLDSKDLVGLTALAIKLAKAKWPNRDFRAQISAGEFNWPFKDGTKRADKVKAKGKQYGEAFRGKKYISARTGEKYPPQLCGLVNGAVVDFDSEAAKKLAERDLFFPGALVYARLSVNAYDGDKGDGVNLRLNMLLGTGQGTKIAGGQKASEVFGSYAGKLTAEDPTRGDTDDEIPF